MKKFYTYLFTILSLVISGSLSAQNVSDAVRWSWQNPGGTARVFGVGGAFGAMGGDFSVVSINPAGLGEYASSEFMFTPSLSFAKSNAYLKGDPTRTSREQTSSFLIDNIGLLINSNPVGSNWTHSNFGIGFNKIADLNNTFYYEGKTLGSITEEFTEYANGRNIDELDDFRAYPAYYVGAIYDFEEDENYETDFQADPLLPVNKSQFVDQSGYINELSLSWAGKYDNKLNFGVSLGIPIVSYEESKTYTESDPDQEIPVFEKLDYTEYLNTSGAGVNFKAGFIYELAKSVRIGGAIHSPTWYTLNDDYYTNIAYRFVEEEVNNFEYRSPDGSFKYKINSPWRAIGSVGALYRISQDIVGFVNADVEWLDYGEAELDLTEYSNDPAESQKTTALNREISQFLGTALNVRVGTELGIRKLRLRAGFESSQSPFSADTERNNALSLGFGLREDKYFIDLGWRRRMTTEGYLPYVVLDDQRDPVVNIENSFSRFLLTVGFKF